MIKLKHIVSCNSEDPSFPAENLLKPEVSKRWKCLPGEKEASVVIQLEKASQIKSLDIGNNFSGLIEILVGREADQSTDRYQTLVASSSFMSPVEGRNGTNGNRVRIFNAKDLPSSVVRQKWDRIKIVCIQPFQKKIGFGLAFINIYDAAESPTKAPPSSPKISTTNSPSFLGKFRLKSQDEVEKSLEEPKMMMFKQRSKDSEPSSSSSVSSVTEKAVELKKKRSFSPKKEPAKKSTPEPSKRIEKTQSISGSKQEIQKSEVPSSSTASKKGKEVKFTELFSGVVFTLSGFQNPIRGQLREKGLEMGGKYRPDWSPDSTHLICAFDNTPKMRQVKGKGKIVRKEFILDTHKTERRKSWRKYAFDKRDQNKAESEDELYVDTKTEDSKQIRESKDEKIESTKNGGEKENDDVPTSSKAPVVDIGKDSDDEIYNKSTDKGSSDDESDGGDTDDEIRRVKEKQKKNGTSSPPAKKQKTIEMGPDGLPILPDFFDNHVFFLYGSFGDEERKLIIRRITTFGGKVVNYNEDSVTHIVTHAAWGPSFDEALKDNAELVFVSPEWIVECGRASDRLSPTPFLISK